jgi:hypothetical protein
MLEYVAYALFAVTMIGCLYYVVSSLETEEAPPSKRPEAKQ